MPRRSGQEPWLELAFELGHRVSGLLRDVVPPDAQHHLLNAQRELLTALLLIYEHQAGARRSDARREMRSSPRPRRKRLERIDIKGPTP
jgi:hypothetical protein